MNSNPKLMPGNLSLAAYCAYNRNTNFSEWKNKSRAQKKIYRLKRYLAKLSMKSKAERRDGENQIEHLYRLMDWSSHAEIKRKMLTPKQFYEKNKVLKGTGFEWGLISKTIL